MTYSIILWLIPRYHDIFHDITRYDVISWQIPLYNDIFQDITTYSKISRDMMWYRDKFHYITTYSKISRHIPRYHDIFHDITRYDVISWQIPLYNDIFQDITTYSMISRDMMWYRHKFHYITTYSKISWHIPWHYEIFRDIVTYSIISRHIASYHYIFCDIIIYFIISRYIPLYHDKFQDITTYSMISRYIPLYQVIFHDITIYSIISRYIPHEFIKYISIPYCLFVSLLPSFLYCLTEPVYVRNATSTCFGLCFFRSAAESRNVGTRWFKYDRDWLRLFYTQISPGHIWTTLYLWRWMLRLFFYNIRPRNLLDIPTFQHNPLYVKHNNNYCSAFKIESAGFSETLSSTYQITRRFIPISYLGCQKNKQHGQFRWKWLKVFFVRSVTTGNFFFG